MNAADPCFVLGGILDGKGGIMPLDSGQEGPTWLHIDYSISSSSGWLTELGLPEAVVESLTRHDTRPRSVHYDEGELMFLRGINVNAGADPEDMVSLRVWVERGRVITVRQRRLMAVQETHNELQANRGPKSLPALVVAIVERLADRVVTFVDDLEDRMETIEAQIEASPGTVKRTEVSAIRRQAAVVRRYLAPQREALDTFVRVARGDMDDETRMVIREQSDRFTRLVEDIDLVRERAMVLQEELLSITMQQQSDRMYALSIVAAIFLPISFITGLFGMNVAGLPGLEAPSAFVYVAGSMVLISGGIVSFFKAKRWL